MKHKKVKWAITVKEKFAKKINKIKDFPQWEGKAINQDPTFVAFADPSAIVSGLLDGLGSISSFGLGMIALAGIGSISALMVLYKRRR